MEGHPAEYTRALYWVVVPRFVKAWVALVFAIVVTVANAFVVDSQLEIEPTIPVIVNVPELLPGHCKPDGDTDMLPACGGWPTVMLFVVE
jgi:hypothetical protein